MPVNITSSVSGRDGFDLKFSNPPITTATLTVRAKNLEEIAAALDHYYRSDRSDPRHVLSSVPECPLCRFTLVDPLS